MAMMLMHMVVDDYDSWKPLFDSDPAGRKQSATGHTISRSVDDPNVIFIRTDFPSVEEAKTFRQALIDSGVLERPGVTVKVQPTIVEQAEAISY